MQELLRSLPQEYPFRFLDGVHQYIEGISLEGIIRLDCIPEEIRRGAPHILTSFILEGLAQLSVLYVQLTTNPLKDREFPLLGSMNFRMVDHVGWNEKQIDLYVEGIKTFNQQAFLEVQASVQGRTICKGQLGVAKILTEGEGKDGKGNIIF